MRNYLREWRKAADMTQQSVADALKTSKPHVSRLEASKRALTTDWMERFARLFGCEPGDLLRHPNLKTSDEATKGAVIVVAKDNKEKWTLPSTWLQHDVHADPGGVEIYTVVSDTMSPTLVIGDRVIVNVRARHPTPAGIFVLDEDGAYVCMRLQMLPNQRGVVRVSADNPHYAPYEREVSDLDIRGRVVARVHRM